MFHISLAGGKSLHIQQEFPNQFGLKYTENHRQSRACFEKILEKGGRCVPRFACAFAGLPLSLASDRLFVVDQTGSGRAEPALKVLPQEISNNLCIITLKRVFMSYQVLARKWRPAVFPDLVGQEAVVRVLTNSLKHQRLHPALIFAGPRGTGKTSTARILAKSLSCPKIKDLIPCNQCKTCLDINHSRSLDVMEIDGASNNGVEAVRQLTSASSYLPSGAYKIYIIDEVHMLSTGAFNALLKTLEEPPPHVLFIMATTEMRKIPATVISRCQILPFQHIADPLIHQQLKKICKQENTEVEESALWMLVREAKGSLRDAQGLLDQMITFCQNKFNSQDVSEILGLTDRSMIMECLKGLLERDSAQVLHTLQKLQTTGSEPSLFLQNLLKEIRNLLLLKLSQGEGTRTLIPLSQPEQDQLLTWAKEVSVEDIQLLFDMALTGSQKINWVQDSKVFLEMLLLKMSQAPYIENIFGGTTPLTKSASAPSLTKSASAPSLTKSALASPLTKSASAPSLTRAEQDIQKNPFIQKVCQTFSADIVESRS